MRFGYDGRPFHGWARQPGVRTVEGEIRRRGKRLGAIEDLAAARLDVASRTDRGVSARANALALTSPLPGPALLRALDGIAPEIFFSAAREVEPAFRPRSARSRTYRYWEVDPVGTLAAYRRAARAAVGEIDVRSFGRDVPPGRAAWRTVERIEVVRSGPGLRIEIEGRSFVWGMVRKLVGSIRQVVGGDLPLERFRSALAGQVRLTPPLAEPEPLVLWEVAYDAPWTIRAEGHRERQLDYLLAERRNASARSELLAALADRPFSTDEASKVRVGSP